MSDQSSSRDQSSDRSRDRLSDQSRVEAMSDQSRVSDQSRDMLSDLSRSDQLSDRSSECEVNNVCIELTGGGSGGGKGEDGESLCMKPEVRRLLERLYYLTKKLEAQVNYF